MAFRVINENVNITEFPVEPYYDSEEVTIPDLHGNALKLLYALIKHSAIQNTQEASDNVRSLFEILKQVYQKNIKDITSEDLALYEAALKKVEFNKNLILRDMGDEVCDRGKNDYLTLLLFERLTDCGVNVPKHLSNHALEFIEKYESLEFENEAFGGETNLMPSQSRSMINMQYLIVRGLVSFERIKEIIDKSFKPELVAFSYSLMDGAEPGKKKIIIHSHAPVGFNVIAACAKRLNVPADLSSAIKIAETIENINDKFFEDYVLENKVSTLINPYLKATITNTVWRTQSRTVKPLPRNFPSIESAPFELLTCNRRIDLVENDRPPVLENGDEVYFSNGHDESFDMYDTVPQNVLPLDTPLGKGDDQNEGNYRVICSSKAHTVENQFVRKTIEKEEELNEERSSQLGM